MACVNPYYIKKFNTYVPCGQCYLCKSNNSTEWTVRIQAERLNPKYRNGIFLTLTVNDESIGKVFPRVRKNPVSCYSLSKRPFQLFMKRFRKAIASLGYDSSIKYLMCGEYGGMDSVNSLYTEKLHRPHYHVILLGGDIFSPSNREELKRILCDTWTYCDSFMWNEKGCIGSIDTSSIKYVCGYVNKKLSDRTNYSHYGLLPPFKLSSKNLGKDFFMDCIKKHTYDKHLRVKVRLSGKLIDCRIPRTFWTHIDDDDLLQALEDIRLESRLDECPAKLRKIGLKMGLKNKELDSFVSEGFEKYKSLNKGIKYECKDGSIKYFNSSDVNVMYTTLSKEERKNKEAVRIALKMIK